MSNQPDLAGRRLGKYEIIEEIGRGGFAVVYKALDTALDRTVALKVLKPHYLDEPEFVARLQQEARSAANLFHPNVVTIFEVGEEAGSHFIAMRYLEGETLRSIIREQGPLELDQAMGIVEQIASALDYIHSQDLVHRDVKPSNIIVGNDGHATLTDFGIVRAADGTRYTTTGASMGTPEYMSPEQAKGEELDYRSDVYSLGVVLYEMLAGQVPFRSDTALAILRSHADERPPQPSRVNPNIPTEVETVLFKALAKDLDARYQSGESLIEALHTPLIEVYPDRLSPTLSPERATEPGTSWITKRDLLAITFLVFVAGLLVGWQYIGWLLLPVDWTNADPYDLRREHKEAYVSMAADSYALNSDGQLARQRMVLFQKQEISEILDTLIEQREAVGDAQGAQNIRQLADVLDVSFVAEPPASAASLVSSAGPLLSCGFLVAPLLILCVAVATICHYLRKYRAVEAQ